VGELRPIADPFTVPGPAGVAIRDRLRLSEADAAVPAEVGAFLGSLADRDLKTRCAAGREHDNEQWAARKRELTEAEWRERWRATRLFCSADGESGKRFGVGRPAPLVTGVITRGFGPSRPESTPRSASREPAHPTRIAPWRATRRTGRERGDPACPGPFGTRRSAGTHSRSPKRNGRQGLTGGTPDELKDRMAEESVVPEVEAGVDPGSRHTGLSLFTATPEGMRRGVFALQLDHRGGRIRDKLAARAQYRRGRRSRNLRYRAPRFSNRTRPAGWLAPSLRHRVDGTLSWITRLCRWAPVRALHVERVAFDTSALAAGRPLAGVEYQQGTLAGYEVREYLLAKWDRTCAYCGVRDVPLNIDHIHPRSRGGSDRISNLTLACVPCNQAKDARSVEEFLKSDPKRLARILAQARTPLRDAAAMNATRQGLWRALTATGLPVHAASGGRTTGRFNIRSAHGLVQGIGHRHVRLLQRADGYGYTTAEEATVTGRSAFPPRSEGRGFHAGGN
jgi:hypothetical protein